MAAEVSQPAEVTGGREPLPPGGAGSLLKDESDLGCKCVSYNPSADVCLLTFWALGIKALRVRTSIFSSGLQLSLTLVEDVVFYQCEDTCVSCE